MSKKEIRDAIDSNQKIINYICFILAASGTIFLIKIILSYTIAYSLITIGSATLSWILSIFFGLLYLINKGKYLSAAEYATKDNPVNVDIYKAPRYFRRQFNLLLIGGGFLILWLVWRIFANTYSLFPE